MPQVQEAKIQTQGEKNYKMIPIYIHTLCSSQRVTLKPDKNGFHGRHEGLSPKAAP